MIALNPTQPDVKLVLDQEGVIKRVVVANDIAGEPVDGWLGMRWGETVADGDSQRVGQLIERAIDQGISPLFQVTQRFPSGLVVPIEYMAVRFDEEQGLLAIGKDVRAVAQLQSRLAVARESAERGSWTLREVETRYRALFEASNDAMLVVRGDDLRVSEANQAAMAALGLTGEGPDGVANADLLQHVALSDRPTLKAAAHRAGERGQAPRILVHLGPRAQSWLVRMSSLGSDQGPLLLAQLHPAGEGEARAAAAREVSTSELIARSPDGFAVLDQRGVILLVNTAFLELVQLGTPGSVIGENLGKWLGRPGGDMRMLLELLRSNGSVRLFPSTVRGSLDSRTQVEISAVSNNAEKPRYIGVFIRDVSRRPETAGQSARLADLLQSMTKQLGKTGLKELVSSTVGLVERHYIEAALEITGGNRTAAAGLLGISRQGLYVKLARYEMQLESEATSGMD